MDFPFKPSNCDVGYTTCAPYNSFHVFCTYGSA